MLIYNPSIGYHTLSGRCPKGTNNTLKGRAELLANNFNKRRCADINEKESTFVEIMKIRKKRK